MRVRVTATAPPTIPGHPDPRGMTQNKVKNQRAEEWVSGSLHDEDGRSTIYLSITVTYKVFPKGQTTSFLISSVCFTFCVSTTSAAAVIG